MLLSGVNMPYLRPHRKEWRVIRLEVYVRDGGQCQSPLQSPICQGKPSIPFNQAQIDHIHAGANASNGFDNLRVLCPVCHALRNDGYHDGIRGVMLKMGRLPSNWEEYLW